MTCGWVSSKGRGGGGGGGTHHGRGKGGQSQCISQRLDKEERGVRSESHGTKVAQLAGNDHILAMKSHTSIPTFWAPPCSSSSTHSARPASAAQCKGVSLSLNLMWYDFWIDSDFGCALNKSQLEQ
jgi:hypothetical protein